MKALEKDRNRRYESASALAADVRALFEGRAGGGVSAVASVSLRQIPAAAPNRRADDDGPNHRVAAGCRRRGLGGTGPSDTSGGGGSPAKRHRKSRRGRFERSRPISAEGTVGQCSRSMARAKGRLAGSGLDVLQAKVDERRREFDVISQLEEAHSHRSCPSLGPKTARQICHVGSGIRGGVRGTRPRCNGTPHCGSCGRILASPIRSQLVAASITGPTSKDVCPTPTASRCGSSRNWQTTTHGGSGYATQRWPKIGRRWSDLRKRMGFSTNPLQVYWSSVALLTTQEAWAAAEVLLRRAQRRYPADFRINHDLGVLLSVEKWVLAGAVNARKLSKAAKAAEAADDAEAARFLQAALALRPQSPHVYVALANAIRSQGLEKEPEVEDASPQGYRPKIRLRPGVFLSRRWPEIAKELPRGRENESQVYRARSRARSRARKPRFDIIRKRDGP